MHEAFSDVIRKKARSDGIMAVKCVKDFYLMTSTGKQVHIWDLRNLKSSNKNFSQPGSANQTLMIPNANLLEADSNSIFMACNDVLITRDSDFITKHEAEISDKYLVNDSTITGITCKNGKVVTGTSCGMVNLWDFDKSKVFHDLPSVSDLVSYEDDMVVCCDDFGHVVVLDGNLELVGEINNTHTSNINSLETLRGNIFTASGDSTIKVWKPF